MLNNSLTLNVRIERDPRAVYQFVSNPENLSKWAGAFCKSVSKLKDGWIVETPQGPMSIRFVTKNELGVADHYVMPAPGVEIYVPMRVVANGSGSEVIFTLFQLPGMPDEKFAEDVRMVQSDLNSLKQRLEQ